MKLLRLLLVLLSPMLLFLGCKKEKSIESGGASASQWEFTEGSNNFHGKVDTAYKTEIAAGVTALMLEGTSDDGTGQLTLGILGLTPTGVGVYQTPVVLFDYTKGTGTVYQNDITATGQFTIEITRMDSASVTGVFSGKVKDSLGAQKTITNGKFSARFGSSNNPGGTGQITVWSKAGCGTGTGPIKVELVSSIATISSSVTAFTATEPACGAAGTATFNVPAGTYTRRAICGTDTASQVITVAAGQCIKSEVVFGAQAQTGQASFWAKASCSAGGNITVRLSNSQTGTISSFTPAAPTNCTASGNANFTLPAGSYTWVAKCGATDSITGSLTVLASQCAKVEVIFPSGPAAQYTLVSTSGNCSNFQVHGTYFAGKPLSPDTNTVTVQVNVTAIGSYIVNTNTVNGYSFSASGNFTNLGVQTITLKSLGTPVTTGTNSFLVTAGSSTCSFAVTVLAQPATTLNKWSFTDATLQRNYSGDFDFGIFADDFFGFGKALGMTGGIATSDTAFDLYIQFPATATQPIPGTYVTDPDIQSSNTSYVDLYNGSTLDEYYYVKMTLAGPPPDVKMTIIIASYDPATKIVKGTFSGKAWNRAGQIINITNGKFEAEVTF
jgi:hypothetical protein